MGSINYGALKARPAERMGGLIFAERFESAAEVVKNGGVITGAPLSNGIFSGNGSARINYLNDVNGVINKLTIMISNVVAPTDVNGENTIISTLKSGGSGFAVDWALNRLYFFVGGATANCYIAVTAGQVINHLALVYDGTQADNANRLNIYFDGVIQAKTIAAGVPTSFLSPSNITIGAWADNAYISKTGAKIGRTMIFKNALDAAIILSFANGTLWNYDNNCVLWMDGKLRNYDPTNTRILDASKNGNNMTLTASGFTKSLKKGYTQNVLTTATGYVTALNNTILAANSGTQTLFWLGKINGLNYTPLLGNSNFAVGLTNGQKVYSRSFKPDKSYTNRITAEKIRPNQINSVCSVKSSNTLSVFINGIKTALTASEVGYERDITKFAFGYSLDLYADLADITTTSAADVICFAFFNIALNQIQAIDLHLRMTQDLEV